MWWWVCGLVGSFWFPCEFVCYVEAGEDEEEEYEYIHFFTIFSTIFLHRFFQDFFH